MKKKLLRSIESWLFNRDPYGFLQSLHNWVVVHPLYILNNQGFFPLLRWEPTGTNVHLLFERHLSNEIPRFLTSHR